MKLPSWADFNKGLSKFEQEIEVERTKVTDRIQNLKDAHPVLDKIIKVSLDYLPPPFNGIAKTIYDSFENTKKDIAIEEVLKFLHDIRKEGEEQYKEIAFKLDIIKDDMAKQETLLLIKDFLVNKDSPINQKLDEILSYVKEYKEKPLSPQQAIIASHPKPKTFHGEKPIFVGRQNYIEQVKEYFRTSNDPITIFGMGGMGKSSLAFEAIHQSEDIFDLIIPIYFAELGISLDSFLSSIAKTLNISIVDFDKLELQDRKQFLIDTLGRSHTHTLIFVDNYETISGVLKDNPSHAKYNEAVQINGFLKRVPSNNTSILLTSRLKKNLDKERVISIDSLTIDEGIELFIKLAGDEELKRSTKNILMAIKKLVKKTGRHPLSIEILSRSYQGAGLEEIEVMLNYLGIGEHNPEEEQERLRSLEACFEYSINNLDENLRQLLPNLILFKSPFPSSTASEIFDTNKLDIINLYNRSLLVRIELDEYGKINEEHVLYNFHPALRNYLENEVTRRNYLEITYGEKFSQYYSKLLYETYNAIGKETHVVSMRRFNLIIEGENNDFDRAIEITKDPKLRSYLLGYLGFILQTLGMLTTALQYYKKSLVIHEELNDKVGMAGGYGNIGNVLSTMGNHKEALDYHKKALAIHEELNDKVGMAGGYGNIGVVFHNMGNLKEALDYIKKALAIDEELNDKVGMSRHYINIGNVLRNIGNHKEALDYHKKALAIDEELNDKVGMAGGYGNIGVVLDDMGNLKEALDYHKKALAIHEELNDKVGMSRHYINIGNVLRNIGNHKEALDYHKKALAIDEELNDKVGMAGGYGNIGNVLDDMGNHKEALDYHKKALAIDEELNDKVGMANHYGNIGVVLDDMGNLKEALDYHKKALAIHEELNDKVGMARGYGNIGNVLNKMGNPKEALKSFSKSLAILQEFEKKTGYHHPLIEQLQAIMHS